MAFASFLGDIDDFAYFSKDYIDFDPCFDHRCCTDLSYLRNFRSFKVMEELV